MAPLTGILVDRWGPRRMISLGALFLASGLSLLSFTNSLGMFYGAFFVIAAGVSFSSTTVLMTSMAHWYHRKIGLASGIVLSGYACGALLVPVVVNIIDAFGWRSALLILAVAALVTIFPLSLVFRHKPESYGFLPDGDTGDINISSNELSQSNNLDVSITTRQAVRSAAFWQISLAFACHVIVTNALVVHVMPYLSSINISRSASSVVATLSPMVSLGGRLGLGWLGDHFPKRYVAAASFGTVSLGLLFFEYTSSIGQSLLIPFIILFGIGWGGGAVMRTALTREVFGRNNFGAVFGLITGMNSLGAITGSPIAGLVFDTQGSYSGIWIAFSGLAVIALIMVLTIKPVNNLGTISN